MKKNEEASSVIEEIKRERNDLREENHKLKTQLKKSKEEKKAAIEAKETEKNQKMAALVKEMEQLKAKSSEKMEQYKRETEKLKKENQDLATKIELLEEVIFQSELAKKQSENQRNEMLASLQSQMETEISGVKAAFQNTIKK